MDLQVFNNGWVDIKLSVNCKIQTYHRNITTSVPSAEPTVSLYYFDWLLDNFVIILI